MPIEVKPAGFLSLNLEGGIEPAAKFEADVIEWEVSKIRGETEITIKLRDGDRGGACTIVLYQPRPDRIKSSDLL